MGKTIVIDSGHGGEDPGACANEREEAALNWDFATVLVTRARVAGLKAIMVPHTPATTQGLRRLKERVAVSVSNKADVFISIHWNASPNPNVRGTEAWYAQGDQKSADLAHAIVEATAHALYTSARHVRPDNENRLGRLGVLHGHMKKTKALLLEVGFISNEQDLKNYDSMKTKVADAIIAVLNV